MLNVIRELTLVCSDPSFRDRIVSFLERLCLINTTPGPDVADLAQREDHAFRCIIEELNSLSFAHASVTKRPISPTIEGHLAYSRPFYTQTENNPGGLSAADTYRDRYNLLYATRQPGADEGRSTAVNVHIDTVPPYFPPRRHDDLLYGRGSADDKGNVAVLIGALIALDQLTGKGVLTVKNNITAMFVIDEEIGGNGSLDLALDGEFAGEFSSLLVLECTGNKVHPANRGAVYFACEVGMDAATRATAPRITPLEALIGAVLELEEEGRAIRRESDHPLFPERPVHTCLGILGPFGMHPSSICGQVGFALKDVDAEQALPAITLALNKGLARYIDRYGDKSTVFDPSTGTPKVEKHFEIEIRNTHELSVMVHGATGHMGSLPSNDAAITKWAYLAEELYKEKLEGMVNFTMEFPDAQAGHAIVLEGAQGFLPTHTIGEIQERMTSAFNRGIRRYAELAGLHADQMAHSIGFEKLHNDAYTSDIDSPSVANARKAGILAATMDRADPLVGWEASCDARIFANEYPDLPVITAGAGQLQHAHSIEEMIQLPELFKGIVFTALFMLLETGSIG